MNDDKPPTTTPTTTPSGYQTLPFEEVERLRAKVRGRPATYPWDEWLAGPAVILVEGEDFTCRPDSLRSLAQRTAQKMGFDSASLLRLNRGEPEFVIFPVVYEDEDES